MKKALSLLFIILLVCTAVLVSCNGDNNETPPITDDGGTNETPSTDNSGTGGSPSTDSSGTNDQPSTGDQGEQDSTLASEGLEFTLNNDGLSYSVVGIGTCIDTDVVIPSMYNGKPVITIYENAFYACDSIVSITIPKSITGIYSSAFWGCDSMTSIIVSQNNEYYQSIDGNLYSKDKKEFVLYAPGRKDSSFTIPDGITKINNNAFFSCDSLINVIIPDSVTSIGGGAFRYCSSLESVNIPDGVISIGTYAFSGCNSLTSIVIPDSVTGIYSDAFSNCTSLTSITIGSGVTELGYGSGDVFENCTSLKSLHIKDLAAWCNIKFTLQTSNPMYYTRNFYLNGNLLTNLIVPNGVTGISNYAFYACSSIESIIIPDSVTSIGDSAFYACNNVESITIPRSIKSIGDSAFARCASLTSIYFDGTVEEWNAIQKNNGWNYGIYESEVICSNGTVSVK